MRTMQVTHGAVLQSCQEKAKKAAKAPPSPAPKASPTPAPKTAPTPVYKAAPTPKTLELKSKPAPVLGEKMNMCSLSKRVCQEGCNEYYRSPWSPS